MINRTDKLPLARQAMLLDISRGSVYYLPQGVSPAELALMRALDGLHLQYPFMGSRQLLDQLHRLGFAVGRLYMRTLMRRMGIKSLCPQPGTNKPCPGHNIYPYLLRKLPVTQANQVWVLDATYIPMARGFVYLTAVVDVASRLVLAHKVAISLKVCHAKQIVQEAFAIYGKPEIISTDQGSQFTATEFTEVVLSNGIKLSMDGREAWRENVFVERLWRTVKYEHVYKHAYADVKEAKAKITAYLHWHNTGRGHSSLAQQTPDQWYWANLPKMKEAA